jgi:hypothetical protein
MKSQRWMRWIFFRRIIITTKDVSACFKTHLSIVINKIWYSILIYVALLDVCILSSSILKCIFKWCFNSDICQHQHVVTFDLESLIFQFFRQNVVDELIWLGFDSRLNQDWDLKNSSLASKTGPMVGNLLHGRVGVQETIFLYDNPPQNVSSKWMKK